MVESFICFFFNLIVILVSQNPALFDMSNKYKNNDFKDNVWGGVYKRIPAKKMVGIHWYV